MHLITWRCLISPASLCPDIQHCFLRAPAFLCPEFNLLHAVLMQQPELQSSLCLSASVGCFYEIPALSGFELLQTAALYQTSPDVCWLLSSFFHRWSTRCSKFPLPFLWVSQHVERNRAAGWLCFSQKDFLKVFLFPKKEQNTSESLSLLPSCESSLKVQQRSLWAAGGFRLKPSNWLFRRLIDYTDNYYNDWLFC